MALVGSVFPSVIHAFYVYIAVFKLYSFVPLLIFTEEHFMFLYAPIELDILRKPHFMGFLELEVRKKKFMVARNSLGFYSLFILIRCALKYLICQPRGNTSRPIRSVFVEDPL